MQLSDDNLLNDVAIHLDILSLNKHMKLKLEQMIASGKQYLRRFAPDLTDTDFADPDNSAKNLLLAYCLYARSNATSAFMENYKADILMLRQEYEVREYENQDNS